MANKLSKLVIGVCLAFSPCVIQPAFSQGTLSDGTKWDWNKGTIVFDTPQRPSGQQHALGMTAPKLKVVRVGFVGLGSRGPWAVTRWTNIPGVQIVALCDHEKDRAERCQNILRKANMPEAAIYSGSKGYEELCKRNDIDLVYIATDWKHHTPVALCAMENGKHAVIEVPAAVNMKECWDLINMSEKTRKHCMMLENCCYDWFELDALNMAQKGVFGEVLRVQGAYIHTLGWGGYWRENPDDKLDWRLDFNYRHRGDIYPTHGFGPVAQVLNLHRGDRMRTLTAMDTKSVNGKAAVEQATGETCNDFRNGDHTTTLIRTQNGKVIEIQHNVMTPQPYNRLYQLTGTKGFANKYPTEGFAVGSKQLEASGYTPQTGNLSPHSFMPKEEMQALRKAYESPIAKRYREMAAKVGGHGGMDYTMDARLIYCLQNGLPLDMDVYDLAEWCCIAELGQVSMDNDCSAVAIPDFTCGHWNDHKGFKHAFASPEEEAKSQAEAEAFTKGVKEGGVKFLENYWKTTTKVVPKSRKKK